MPFREIPADTLPHAPFALLRDGWPLLTAEGEEQTGTMTVNWGGMCYLWNKCLTAVFVRPQRNTYHLLEEASGYSLCFFSPQYHEQMAYCGRASGRDEDKIARCGFTLAYRSGIPYFEEADTVLLCQKLYSQPLDPQCILDPAVFRHYPEGDYHRMYLGEVVCALQREAPAPESDQDLIARTDADALARLRGLRTD